MKITSEKNYVKIQLSKTDGKICLEGTAGLGIGPKSHEIQVKLQLVVHLCEEISENTLYERVC